MASPDLLNKVLVVVCIFTQVVAAAGMVILMDLFTSFGGGTTSSNYIVLLVYGFVSAILITLADIVQPKFWKEHVTVFKYFIGRTFLYIPYGALVYFDTLPSTYDKRGFLLVRLNNIWRRFEKQQQQQKDVKTRQRKKHFVRE